MYLASFLLLIAQSGDLDQTLEQAAAAANQGNFSQAVRLLEDAGAAKTEDAKALTALGTYMLRDTEARAATNQLSGLDVVDAFQRTAQMLKKASEASQAPPAAFEGLSEAYLNTGDFRNSMKAVANGLDKHPKDFSLLMQSGRVHAARRNELSGEKQKQALEAAASAYSQAMNANAKSGAACVRHGEILIYQGNRTAAAKAWQEGLDRNPEEVDVGAMLQWLGTDAAQVLEAHMQKRGENATYRWYQGLAHYNAQPRSWQESKKYFEDALRLNPQFTTTYYYLGQGAMDAGHAENSAGNQGAAQNEWRYSAQSWGKYLKHHGANQIAGLSQAADKGDSFVATAKWLAGQAYPRDIETSIEISRWVVQARSQDVEAWNNLAFFCRDGGKPRESLDAYKEAYRLSPQDPQVMNDLAVIYHYYLKTHDEEATALYEKAIQRAEELLAEPDKLTEEQQGLYRVALRDARNNLRKLQAGDRING